MTYDDAKRVLEISDGFTPEALKSAWHKAAHRFHPDKPGGDAVKFKEAKAAFDLLQSNKPQENYSFQYQPKPTNPNSSFTYSWTVNYSTPPKDAYFNRAFQEYVNHMMEDLEP